MDSLDGENDEDLTFLTLLNQKWYKCAIMDDFGLEEDSNVFSNDALVIINMHNQKQSLKNVKWVFFAFFKP